MRMRTKLLLYFLTLCAFTMLVSLIFYVQLQSLIEPLTPDSIPKSVEYLENTIEKNTLLFKLVDNYQKVQRNVDDYVLTDNKTSLQEYYKNQALLVQLLEQTRKSDAELWRIVAEDIEHALVEQDRVVDLMKRKQYEAAKKIAMSLEYTKLRQKIGAVLDKYYADADLSTNEDAFITIKLAAKNTIHVLEDSINASIIIFLNAIAVSLLFAWVSAHAVSRPIFLLRKNMDSVTSKNFDAAIDPKLLNLRGEIGDLSRSFSELVERLRDTTVSRDELLIEIQHRIQVEENLRRTAQHLEESNRELDQFAYSASHDLREPLRGIENLAQWIKEDCFEILPEESKKHFDLLTNRVRRLSALIKGILDYSRASHEQNGIQLVDINVVVNEVIDILALPENITVTIDSKMPTVEAYRAAISRVFYNLVSNAIKFNDKEKGFIHIGCRELDNEYEFYVSDNGIGIEEQYFEKIFEIFQTLHSRDSIGGTGIGLALVKKDVVKHGGKIFVKSKLGEGSTFYFTWPKNFSQLIGQESELSKS